MSFYDIIKADLDIQEKLINRYTRQLSYLPKGKLTYKRVHGHRYYYLNNKQYLSAKKAGLVQGLKTRAYLEKSIRIMDSNIRLENHLLKTYQPYDFASVNDSLPPAYQSDPKIAAKDPSNEFQFGSAPIHRTSFGLFTRSKSEALIAELLHAEGIKFNYEEPLDLIAEDGSYITVHPDFTLYLNFDKKVYWEHAGLLTDLTYRESFFKKLGLYYDNGITISDKLLISADTPIGGFDAFTVKKLIYSIYI